MNLNLDILLDNLKDWGIFNYKTNSDGTIDVHQNIYWASKELTELPDLNISKVFGYFDISNNKLSSLKNCPKEITGSFNCSYNNLQSLENGPEIVDGEYLCFCNKLKSLKGCPEILILSLFCMDNKITSFKEGPKVIFENFYYQRNPVADLDKNNDIPIHEIRIEKMTVEKACKLIKNHNFSILYKDYKGKSFDEYYLYYKNQIVTSISERQFNSILKKIKKLSKSKIKKASSSCNIYIYELGEK